MLNYFKYAHGGKKNEWTDYYLVCVWMGSCLCLMIIVFEWFGHETHLADTQNQTVVTRLYTTFFITNKKPLRSYCTLSIFLPHCVALSSKKHSTHTFIHTLLLMVKLLLSDPHNSIDVREYNYTSKFVKAAILYFFLFSTRFTDLI